MHAWSRWIGLWAILASAVLMLPSLADDNKEPAKKEQKDADPKKEADPKKDADPKKEADPKKDADPKKEPAKGDDPKDEKKDPKKKDKADPKPPEEKVVWGTEIVGKLKQMDANSQKDFTITITYKLSEPNLDAQRQLVQQQQQLAQQKQQLAQHQFNLKRAQNAEGVRSAQEAIRNANQQIFSTMNSIRQTQSNLFRTKDLSKDMDVRAAENIKVRSLYPPVVYDDKGQLKAWTVKDLAILRAGSKLPGYPAEFEVLRPGQIVRVYMAKQAAPKSGGPKAKKNEDDDDLPMRPEVVMILVEREATPQR